MTVTVILYLDLFSRCGAVFCVALIGVPAAFRGILVIMKSGISAFLRLRFKAVVTVVCGNQLNLQEALKYILCFCNC